MNEEFEKRLRNLEESCRKRFDDDEVVVDVEEISKELAECESIVDEQIQSVDNLINLIREKSDVEIGVPLMTSYLTGVYTCLRSVSRRINSLLHTKCDY